MTMQWTTAQRWALTVAYDGAYFHGWQKQPGGLVTLQSALEAAISQVAAQPVAITVAGRTDAGVHATAQVVHFDTTTRRPESAWMRGVNTVLDQHVRVMKAQPVAAHFHARFDAFGRRYRYVLMSSPVRPPQLQKRVGWTHLPLDMGLMREAAALLIGEHDFSSFRASDCQAKTPIKTLYDVHMGGSSELMVMDFYGNAFLHHMVRNMVGALVYVGSGKLTVAGFAELMARKNRQTAPPTFMPDGLYLTGVDYPPEFGVNTPPLPVWLWPDW